MSYTKNTLLKSWYDKLSELIYWHYGKPYWAEDYGVMTYDDLAGFLCPCGYRRITITIDRDTRVLLGHRLRWYMEYKVLPLHCILHKNGRFDDNNINNLKIGTRRGYDWGGLGFVKNDYKTEILEEDLIDDFMI